MTPAEREKKIADLIADVALMPWYRHPEQGWFCPFGCHIYERDKRLLLYDQPPAHRPQCGIVLAQELHAERKARG